MNRYIHDLSHPDQEEINDDLKEYVSDQDLRDYFGDSFDRRILKYSELSNYPTINDLLPKKKDFCIILVENEPNSGHWVALLKYEPNIIEFFNSYGDSPGSELSFNSKSTNEELDQSRNIITDLLDKAMEKNTVIYNKKKFQKLENDINTCGKNCIFRCICLKKYKLNLPKYINFVKDLKAHYKMSADELVSLLIPINED